MLLSQGEYHASDNEEASENTQDEPPEPLDYAGFEQPGGLGSTHTLTNRPGHSAGN